MFTLLLGRRCWGPVTAGVPNLFWPGDQGRGRRPILERYSRGSQPFWPGGGGRRPILDRCSRVPQPFWPGGGGRRPILEHYSRGPQPFFGLGPLGGLGRESCPIRRRS
ncbi:hypothetical protein XELAEV_18016214mg [Xenopus laevis]|uniref:Uncharacterized protein n=1 Tax=Xenopus laevis TaxID=8355 RepID=A0A974DJJ5_XENLA|nr:hypothetical protein XELAEV_18016214mg [Xenopus laevis]